MQEVLLEVLTDIMIVTMTDTHLEEVLEVPEEVVLETSKPAFMLKTALKFFL